MRLKEYLMGVAVGIAIGFSVAMGLVGDSPWSEFWLRVARGGR